MKMVVLSAAAVCAACLAGGARAPVEYVNPLIGTQGSGSQYGGMWPGVCTPFASLQWCAMTRLSEVGRTSYNHSDDTVTGFVGTRQPAIWMGEWAQVSLMPETGEPDGNFLTRARPFSHADETATPWFYSVTYPVAGGEMRVAMTGTQWCGMFEITAPAAKPLSVVIDASRDFTGRCTDRTPQEGFFEVGADGKSVCGWNSDRNDAMHAYPLPNFKGWFVIEFSRPFTSFGVFKAEQKTDPDAYATVRRVPGVRTARGDRTGGYVTFAASGEPLIARVGTSLISLEQARRNLAREAPAERPFAAAVAAARRTWEEAFARLTIETPDEDVKTIFYTGLYHALLYPKDITEEGRYYSAFDDAVHTGTAYTSYSLWDTYRSEHALLTLVAPERVDGMMNALLQDFDEGGWLPMWPNPSYTGIMMGGCAEMALAEAWSKGFRGFDVKRAYAAVTKNATEPQPNDAACDWRDRGNFGRTPETRGGLSWYLSKGYVPCDRVKESVSRTQDFALNDTACAILARAAGDTAAARMFTARAQNYTNTWCAAEGFFLPHRADGSFADTRRGHDYCETSADTALWCVPHDPRGLAALMGGAAVYEARLDRYFSELFFKPDGRGNGSIHGNEPSHHVAYMYNGIGRYAKTQKTVRDIMRRCYSAGFKGFDGNEDCGQMSAWYILNAIGIYPLNPATPWYEIGSPLVQRATLRIGAPYKPATLRITARNAAPENVYVKRVTLNGRELADFRIHQSDLVRGGELVFEMSREP